MPDPKPRPPEEVDEKRRKVTIAAVATGFAGIFLALNGVQKSIEAGGALLTEIGEVVRHLRDESGDLTHRVDLLRSLFRVSGNLHIPAPREHPLSHKPGPHDLAAMAVPASMYRNPAVTSSPVEAPLMAVDTLFVVGSPLNSALAAMFLPAANVRVAHKINLVLNEQTIPYHFLGGDSESLSIRSATAHGAERRVYNNGLLNCGTPWHPVALASQGDWLETDFLLVSVLPWNRGGGRAVLISGGHGPGTHALDLLLSPSAFPLSMLEALVKDLKETEAFQIVFEVSVRHDGPYSMPAGIRISSNLPPKKLGLSSPLFRKSDEHILHTISGSLRTF
jgi:hypothetical protein